LKREKMANTPHWPSAITDARGKKVVFLSHCLLNENTRYLGGACRAGCIEEVLKPCLDRGIGIIQMPCPEQLAWGGVLKRRLLIFFGAQGKLVYEWRNHLLPILVWYTKRRYRKLAREIARQIKDYVSSEFDVVGIVGVDGSPSCGVNHTLNMKHSLASIGRLADTAGAEMMNEVVMSCREAGQGLFVQVLRNELKRHNVDVPFLAHDLGAELQGIVVPLRLPGNPNGAAEQWDERER
jgi:predicted secreted protein